MKKISVVVQNKLGLHARPASMLVRKSLPFHAEVSVENEEGVVVSGKSIMGLMSLAASCGTKLVITVEGKDEEKLTRELKKLFDNKFEDN